ncbi:MAG TPA: FCD domain-containing protein [Pseudonocardiaceae bacterium]|jgi:DNA-binding FadR family transcriptional regulator|nr:FCD domain-containing protein [Pseudonocardiaceae bacterium]
MTDRETPDASDSAQSWALPPDSRRPLPELIEGKLRGLIHRGVFSPGDRLPTEPELAGRLEVARSSLRTALQRLQLQGIVEVKRGRGWYVRAPRSARLDEATEHRYSDHDLLEVRIALETTAVSLAAVRAESGELDDIAKASAQHANSAHTDQDELLRTDEAFHSAVVRASHNEFLERLYLRLVPLLREKRRDSYTSHEVHTRSANDHHQVVMFLRRHDEVAARTAMTTHLLGLYNDLAVGGSQSPDQPAALTTYVGVHDEPIWRKDD